ncbi:ABC transporter permease [Marinicrinis lubricantis]|uniref:ABC transporter permease n=1 Tax=Marinicrinis lubricantis TaxID=2086470 RepID=A0ABW1IU59_9BACL
MNKDLFKVIGFTFRNKARTKSFMVTTLIMAIILSIVINIPYFISKFSSDEPTNIGIIQADGDQIPMQLQQYYSSQSEPDISIKLYKPQASEEANEEMLKELISEGEIDGYLVAESGESAAFPKFVYKSEDNMDFGKSSQLEAGLQIVKTQIVGGQLGLSDEQLAQLYEPIELDTMQISAEQGAGTVGEGKTEAESAMSYALVYVMIIVLFMGIMVSGQLIATEITSEKSSRVMEILITSVSPLSQMFGKILGMFLLAISQISIFIVVTIINLSMPHNQGLLKDFDIDLTQVPVSMYIYAVLFYLVGFFLYATLFAAVGSIVSRTEDLGQAVMPITFISMAGFYIGIFGINAPNSTLVEVTSFIPFFAPFIMFLRIGVADPAVWEVWLSIAILLVTTYVMGWLSAKIYRTGVLMYGKRPSWKEIRKAMKAYKF